MLQPIREKWKTIESLFKAKDIQSWGFVHQSLFMKVLRLAGTLNGMSDDDFLRVFIQGRGIRDKQGFISYLRFGDLLQ